MNTEAFQFLGFKLVAKYYWYEGTIIIDDLGIEGLPDMSPDWDLLKTKDGESFYTAAEECLAAILKADEASNFDTPL